MEAIPTEERFICIGCQDGIEKCRAFEICSICHSHMCKESLRSYAKAQEELGKIPPVCPMKCEGPLSMDLLATHLPPEEFKILKSSLPKPNSCCQKRNLDCRAKQSMFLRLFWSSCKSMACQGNGCCIEEEQPDCVTLYEVCPHCKITFESGDGCPSLRCANCSHRFVRGSQCSCYSGPCIFGCYLPWLCCKCLCVEAACDLGSCWCFS